MTRCDRRGSALRNSADVVGAGEALGKLCGRRVRQAGCVSCHAEVFQNQCELWKGWQGGSSMDDGRFLVNYALLAEAFLSQSAVNPLSRIKKIQALIIRRDDGEGVSRTQKKNEASLE